MLGLRLPLPSSDMEAPFTPVLVLPTYHCGHPGHLLAVVLHSLTQVLSRPSSWVCWFQCCAFNPGRATKPPGSPKQKPVWFGCWVCIHVQVGSGDDTSTSCQSVFLESTPRASEDLRHCSQPPPSSIARDETIIERGYPSSNEPLQPLRFRLLYELQCTICQDFVVIQLVVV